MSVSDTASRIVEELEFIEAERCQLNAKGPHFRIIHRYSERFVPCGPHEEIAAAYLVHAGRTVQVGLGTALLGLFDYMALHNQISQTARQIESGTRPSRSPGVRRTALARSGIPRRYVRIYLDRICFALGIALQKAGIEIKPEAVLVSEETAMNEKGYRLRGTFEWLHTAE